MSRVLLACFALFSAVTASAQVKETSVPLAPVLTKALATSSLTTPGAQPFHLHLRISEPANAQSAYQAVVEEWWLSPTEWRRDITTPAGLHQVIVMHDGVKSEEDTGEYFPLWIRDFVEAAFDPVPNQAVWLASNAEIQQSVLSNGAKSDACAHLRNQVDGGQHPLSVYSSLCFDDQDRLNFTGAPRYSADFKNFRSFNGKQYPRGIQIGVTSNTNLLGTVDLLEKLDRGKQPDTLFLPLGSDSNHFRSVTVNGALMQKLVADEPPLTWPTIERGKTEGALAFYLSADKTGQVREVDFLLGDNDALAESARDQILRWKLKPAKDKAGTPVQIDGALGLSFTGVTKNPLPELSEEETLKLATHTVTPIWLENSARPGDLWTVTVRVDAQGKVAGIGFKDAPMEIQAAIDQALEKWTFNLPADQRSKPHGFIGKLHFIVSPHL